MSKPTDRNHMPSRPQFPTNLPYGYSVTDPRPYCGLCRSHHSPDEASHQHPAIAGGFGGEVQVSEGNGHGAVVLHLTDDEASQVHAALTALEHEHGTLGPALARVKLMLTDPGD